METQDEYSAQGSHFAGSHKVSHYYDTHIQKRQDKKKKKKTWQGLCIFFFKELTNSCLFQKVSLALYLKEKLRYSFSF